MRPCVEVADSSETGTRSDLYAESRKIFTNVEFHYEILAKRLRELSFLNSGVRITLMDERNDRQDVFEYQGGIRAFVEHLNRKKTPSASPGVLFLRHAPRHDGSRWRCSGMSPIKKMYFVSPTIFRSEMAALTWQVSGLA